MLQKLIRNQPQNWESQLGAALTAYRNTTHSATGYTPFFLTYGRRARLPLSLPVDASNDLGDRLTLLGNALQRARVETEKSRLYNRGRINRRANEGNFKVGDTVVMKAEERIKLTSHCDPQYEVHSERTGSAYQASAVRQDKSSKQQ